MFDASVIHQREVVKSIDTLYAVSFFYCNVTDFDMQQEEETPKEEKGCEILIPLKATLCFEMPTPDGDFKIMQLDDTVVQKVKI